MADPKTYPGLSAGAQFELMVQDEQFQADTQMSGEAAKKGNFGWKPSDNAPKQPTAEPDDLGL